MPATPLALTTRAKPGRAGFAILCRLFTPDRRLGAPGILVAEVRGLAQIDRLCVRSFLSAGRHVRGRRGNVR
jgi:hypothetical protein